jgi:hypothetical protein
VSDVGYRVVLPPGWARIPLRDDPARAVDAILDESFRGLPMDSYGPMRKELRRQWLAQVEAARDNEGVDLYLPVERVHGQTIAASFVVSVVSFDSVESPRPEDVLVSVAADTDGTSLTEVDGAPAIRTETVVPAAEGGDESQVGSRRVSYLVSIPDSGDRWMAVSFSTLGDGDPEGQVARLLVDLFDAVVSTLRWLVD